MLPPAPCSSQPQQCHPALSCPQELRGDRGRVRPSRDGALWALPGQGGAGGEQRGSGRAWSSWQGHTECSGWGQSLNSTHGGSPGDNPAAGRVTGEGARGTGGGRAIPAGTGDPAGTYSSRSRQQRERELDRREGRAGEREETQLLPREELLSLREQKQAGTVRASPAERHQTNTEREPQTLRDAKHPPQAATPPGLASSRAEIPLFHVPPWSSHPGWAGIFLQGST